MSAYVYVRVELQHLSLDLGRLSNLSETRRLFSACLGGGRPPSCVPLGTWAASRGRPGDRERARTLELRPAEAGTARRGVRAERHLGAAGGPAPPLPSRRFCSFTSGSWKYLFHVASPAGAEVTPLDVCQADRKSEERFPPQFQFVFC